MTDRDKLIALLDELFKEGRTMTPGYMANYLTKHGVTVQKHGQWLNGMSGNYKICSECKQIADFDFDYCPNCGARMDGE